MCAHRYIQKSTVIDNGNKSTNHLGTGFCYLLSNDLNRKKAVLLKTCFNVDCQTGLSAAIVDDSTVLVGVPGRNQSGAVYLFTENPPNSSEYSLDNTNAPGYQAANLGMAIAYGRFFSPSKMSFAVGAPRYKEYGRVLLYESIKELKPKSIKTLETLETGSNFGYEIISADVNGDKWPDLLIGAPMHFRNSKDPSGGAVYVCINKNAQKKIKGISNPFASYNQKLFGAKESAFGFSMTNLGDINNDQCDDVAIGAPYDGQGVVYIYLGNRQMDADWEWKPFEKIQPSDFPEFIQTATIGTFGFSLAGGVDFDGNSYADLLIGSVKSDYVMALLTRQMFNLDVTIDQKLITDIEQWTPPYVELQLDISSSLISKRSSDLVNQHDLNYQISFPQSSHRSYKVYIDCKPPNNSTSGSCIGGSRDIRLSTNGALDHQKHMVYVVKDDLTESLTSMNVSIF